MFHLSHLLQLLFVTTTFSCSAALPPIALDAADDAAEDADEADDEATADEGWN